MMPKLKKISTSGVVDLLTSILTRSPRHLARLTADKKVLKHLVRLLLKHAASLKEVDTEEAHEEILAACNSLLSQLTPAIAASAKLTQSLAAFYAAEREGLAAAVANQSFQVEASWLQFQLLVLGLLERSLGGWRKQLAAQLLGPLVDWFVGHLVGAEEDQERAAAVRSLVRLGEEVVALLDSSSLRKRLHKVHYYICIYF